MRIILCLAVTFALLVACSGGESAPSTPPTEDELGEALLDASDVPATYKLSRTRNLEDEYAVCDLEGVFTKDLDEEAVIRYTASSDDLILNSGYVLYKEGHPAKDVFKEVSSKLKTCTSWREGSERIGTTFTVAPLSMPKLGDESVAVRVSADNIPVTGSVRGDFVYARYGEVLMVFSNVGKKDQASKQDSELTKSLATKAMDNLKAID